MAERTLAESRSWFRRRKFLIRPWYQLRIAGTIFLFIAAYSLLLGFLIFYPLHQELGMAASPEDRLWVARQVLELHKRFWPSVLVVAVLVAAHSIFVTHRIVGPTQRIRCVLEALTLGQYETQIHLRRSDRLKELESPVNLLGESLMKGRMSRRESGAHLEAAVEKLRKELVLSASAERVLDDIQGAAREFSRGD